MAAEKLPELEYDKLQIGEELGSYEYLLTQEMIDSFDSSGFRRGSGRRLPDHRRQT